MDLDSKVAVVTGGAVRLGRAIALALARRGCELVLHYGTSEGPASETAAEAEALGAAVLTHAADLRDPEEALGLIEAGRERFEQIDILVNSASVFLEGDLAATSLDEWDQTFDVNLRAPFLLSQAFAAQIPDLREGAIVNILDARIRRPGIDHFAYRLTKVALLAMTENLALDLAPRVRVNGVAPGAILPPPGAELEDLNRLARERVPLARAGNADGVAASVIHLLEHDFLTGVTIPVDGGQFL